MEVINTELKQKKTKDGAKKHRVLIEFEAGTPEFAVLEHAEKTGQSIAATMREHVSAGVFEMGDLMGMKNHRPVSEAPAKVDEKAKAKK
jgi:hypothetical protein